MANNDRAVVQSGLDDLLGNVIKSDQKSAGRSQKELEVPVVETPIKLEPDMTLLQYDNITQSQTNKQTNVRDNNKSDTPRELLTPTPKKRSVKPASSESSTLEHRREEAADMARATTMTVTLRIPAPLNEWLDEYVHRSWPSKIKKQALVIEALQILYVRRGRPGEDIIETELLPEQKEGK